MDVQLIIHGDYEEILELLLKIGQTGTQVTGTLEETQDTNPGQQIESGDSLNTEVPISVETKGRKCACGCGNIVTGKRGWNYHYYSLKCYKASIPDNVPAPREFSIPESKDLGPVSNRDRKLKKKLEKIRETCPLPGKRPDIQREFT